MQAVCEYLPPFEQTVRTDHDGSFGSAVQNRTCAYGDFWFALPDLDALAVEKRAPLAAENRVPLGTKLVQRRFTKKFEDVAHKSVALLSFAISRYSLERSMPTDFRPNALATDMVVPVPQKGSRTSPPTGEVARIGILQTSSG